MLQLPMARRERLRIGIVDLMAVVAQGRPRSQFTRLLETHSVPMDLQVMNLAPSTSRSSTSGSVLVDWQLIASFDALIVTGAEPRTADLAHDPTYALVGRLLEVTQPRATPIIFSCLAAHAALHHLYSVERHRLPQKLVGVFEHAVLPTAAPLAVGLGGHVAMPHSRRHTARRSDLVAAGVVPILLTGADDWAVAAGPEGLRYVFLQGHPEYELDVLLREHVRDARRYLEETSDSYPVLPEGYLRAADREALAAFGVRARRHRHPQTAAALPRIELDPELERSWSGPANTLMANWIGQLTGVASV